MASSKEPLLDLFGFSDRRELNCALRSRSRSAVAGEAPRASSSSDTPSCPDAPARPAGSMRSGNGVVTASVPALAGSDEAPQAEFTMASPVSNCVPGETPGALPMPPSLPDR